ncbi:MAG: hypothetical protein GZ088_03600 [Acidipila sp.]|nr:hypothetical protein [Acidipila sp.]
MTSDSKKRKRKYKRRQKVVLKVLPPGLIDGLPEEDQRAITAVVGKPVFFVGYERNVTVRLEFTDKDDAIHLIWVEPKFIKPWRASSVRKLFWEQPEGNSSHANKRNSLRAGKEKRRQKTLHRGQKVILKPLPPEVIGSLPRDDQKVISAVVGRPIVYFRKYERDERAELEFVDHDDTTYLIYIDPRFIKPW